MIRQRLDPVRVVGVIQARCGSQRLPEKVMAPLAGRPVVEHVVTAVRAATILDDVIVATTTEPADDELAALCERLGVRVFRGSEDDVLGRFLGALEGDPADVVVRHTADDPLLDPNIINSVVGHFLKGGCDYASNVIERTWPRGLDTEVVTRDALERSGTDTQEPQDREHVTMWVRRHPGEFTARNVPAPPSQTWPDLRLCIDTAEDQAMLERVFDALYEPGRILHIGAVVDWLRRHPEVAAINSDVEQKKVFGKTY